MGPSRAGGAQPAELLLCPRTKAAKCSAWHKEGPCSTKAVPSTAPDSPGAAASTLGAEFYRKQQQKKLKIIKKEKKKTTAIKKKKSET